MADLFAGIGGFHLAFNHVGAQVVFAAENDPVARRTYEANFRSASPELFGAGNFAGDIRAVDASLVPDFDVLCAGFPCQPFSEAGNRRGFADDRGQLFFEVVRLLAAKRPAAFCLENVRGLQTLQGGRTLDTIRRALTEELGYSFHLQVVRACDFGLPQLRPRLFMVGFREPGTPFRFPDPVPLRLSMDDVFGGRCDRAVGYTVLASGWGKPYGVKRAWDAYLVDGQLRRVGVREARLMQGFPAGFVLPDSPTQAMRLLGNAVALPVAAAVAKEIARSLGYPSVPALTTGIVGHAIPAGQRGD